MAGSVNKVILIGRLGSKPEIKYLPSGKGVCEMSIATDGGTKDKPETEWHKVKAWEKTAENCAQYLDKGRQVYVEGRIVTRSYEKDGEKRFITEIIASNVTFLGGETREAAKRPAERLPGSDDDMPDWAA